MIQVNELRVGNLLTYKGRIITVDGVENDTDTYRETWLIWIKGKGQAEPIADFAPIPLSPEILEACGFERTEYGFVKNAGWWAFEIDNNMVLILAGISHNIKYLHVLQNVFYSLTGSELSVNLEKVKV